MIGFLMRNPFENRIELIKFYLLYQDCFLRNEAPELLAAAKFGRR